MVFDRHCFDALLEHARSCSDEVCGVLIGRCDPLTVDQVVAGRNVQPQPQQHYLIDAATLLHADHLARSTGREIVGFYHSHPHSAAVPSPHDRRDAWPEHVYLIVGFVDDVPYVCAWMIEGGGKVNPVAIHQSPTPNP